MPPKTRSKDRAMSSPKQSPEAKRLYPNLDNMIYDENDEDDESWVMSGNEDVTMSTTRTSSNFNDSSYLKESPGVRQSIHHTDSSFGSPRLRSGKRYGRTSSSDYSDDISYTHHSPSPGIGTKPTSKTMSGESVSTCASTVILYACVALLLLFCFYMMMYVFVYSASNAENHPEPNLYVQFKSQMATFKSKFESQSSKSWKALNVGTKHILNDPNPVYPAIFLMVGPRKALPVMNCISSAMISILNKLHNITMVNENLSNIIVSDLNRRSASLEKLDLDERLHRVFSTGYKGAMLVNVEQLSAGAALMLHSYCDNDNAPFKNILLTLELVSDELSLEETSLNESVEEYLRRLWEAELGTDKLMALLSRIGNNVVLVNPESPQVFDTVCAHFVR